MAGISLTGLEIKRLVDIQSTINEKAINKFGEGINLEDDSLFGQIRDIFSSEISDLWEALQATYDASTPSKAEGINLDDVVARVGISRLDAKPSTVTTMFTGQLGANIPAGTLVAVNTTEEQFFTTASSDLLASNCYSAIVDITVVAASTSYTVTIDGSSYTIISGGSPTANSIATALAGAITADTNIPVSASVVDNRLVLVNDNVSDSSSLSLTVNMSFFEVTCPIEMESVNTGPIQAPTGQLNVIKSSVSGLNSATNLEDALVGRNRETDTELRLRRARNLAIAGTSTLDAIIAKVGQVDAVSSSTGTSNRTSGVVDGLPPHSFEIIVQGGIDTDISQAIWDSMPAGIESYGTSSAIAINSVGGNETVYFTRPTEVDIYVDVEYTLYSEEDFPTAGEATISAIILELGNQLSIGNDVIAQRFFGEIYRQVPGIQSLSITLATAAGTPPYGSTIIPISSKQVPVFDSLRITVSEV